MPETETTDIKTIEPAAIFGFDGQINSGLKVHPKEEHILYPLGSKIGIITISTNKQQFLSGHTNTVSCLDVSPSGSFVASGQDNQIGFRAYVIIWDWNKREEYAKHELHKGKVQAVCFTAGDKYLISLGGEDDGTIIVYDIIRKIPLSGTFASKRTSGKPFSLCRLNRNSTVFVVAGDKHLRVWKIPEDGKKLLVQDVATGKLTRHYTNMRIDDKDEVLYVGTMTGDIVKVRLTCNDTIKAAVLLGCYGKHNPKKPVGKDCEKYINGVRDLHLLNKNQILIGAGNGTVELVEERNASFKDYKNPTWPGFKKISHTKLNGAITSITRLGCSLFIIGTDKSEIYSLTLPTFDLKLLKTCHRDSVYDIVFPKNFPLVFATASYESIRIWSTTRLQELLRIIVHNFTVASIVFSNDGRSIISAWNDGVIRAFTPITGKLIYAIPNAHNKGCTAITISSDDKILVSGGCEGQVRVWKVELHRQSLIGVLKEHSGPIASVDFNRFDTEVVSACSDGRCVIWDIRRLTRKHVLYANTQFMCAKYYPSGALILAAGTDRRISYWAVYDGSLLREVEGSTKGAINRISLNSTGEHFITVSNDQLVKLWHNQKGITALIGHGHAAAIVSCCFSPCGRFFVTGSADGAVLIWDVPEEYWPKEEEEDSRPSSKSSSKKPSISSKRRIGNENIDKLEKTVKNINYSECPPVDSTCKPDVNECCNVAVDAL